MSNEIKELTPAQREKMNEYVEKWTQIGLCNKPADRTKAENAIIRCYEAVKLPPPKELVWCDSPLQMAQAACERYQDFKKGRLKQKQAGSLFVTNLAKRDYPKFPSDIVSEVMNNICYGNHEISWFGFFDFLRHEIGLVEETEELVPLMEYANYAGWFSPWDDICYISERIKEHHFDEQHRLHSFERPAVIYPDDYKVYSIHGVIVPEWLVEEREKLSVELIDQETNAEVHRIMLDIFGVQRYLEESNMELVSKDEWGELYKKETPNDRLEPVKYSVKVINSTPEPDGTYKVYFLPVHPELRPLLRDPGNPQDESPMYGEPQEMTPLNAVASTFGLTGEEYKKVKIQT